MARRQRQQKCPCPVCGVHLWPGQLKNHVNSLRCRERVHHSRYVQPRIDELSAMGWRPADGRGLIIRNSGIDIETVRSSCELVPGIPGACIELEPDGLMWSYRIHQWAPGWAVMIVHVNERVSRPIAGTSAISVGWHPLLAAVRKQALKQARENEEWRNYIVANLRLARPESRATILFEAVRPGVTRLLPG